MNKNSIQDLKSFPQTILKEVSGCVTAPTLWPQTFFCKMGLDWQGNLNSIQYTHRTLKSFPQTILKEVAFIFPHLGRKPSYVTCL